MSFAAHCMEWSPRAWLSASTPSRQEMRDARHELRQQQLQFFSI
jgi:hypothetical protein